MWQNIQKVFRAKTSKSPDPSSAPRINRQSQPDFKINVQPAQASTANGQEEQKQEACPFESAMRQAKVEQQMQGTPPQHQQARRQDSPEASSPIEDSNRQNRVSLTGSPIKQASQFFSMSAQKTKDEFNKLMRMHSNSSSGETGELAAQHDVSRRRLEVIPGNQLTEDQMKVAELLGGGQKTESLVLGLHGFRINDNPQDREVFVSCPQCGLDVFDAGLTNDIKCKTCQIEFTPGCKTITIPVLQKKVPSQNESDADGGLPKESSSEKLPPAEVSAFEVGGGPESTEFLENKKEDDTKESAQLSAGSRKKDTIAVNQEDDDEEEKKDNPVGDGYQPFQNVRDSLSSETDSEEESKHPNYRKREKRRKNVAASSTNTASASVPFTTDNLIERPGKVLQSLFSSLTANQKQTREQGAQMDSSSAYVNELESVLLYVIEETVMEDFKEAGTNNINYKVLLNALLMPYFQLRTRILEKYSYFEIGNIQFYVAGTAPHDFGKITTSSNVRLTASVRKTESIQRINVVPLRRIELSKNELLQNVLKPYFSSNIGSCLYKGQVFEIQEHEFFVKYCRPNFGAISNGTEVKMDSSMPKSVRIVRVAPIWPTQEAFVAANRKVNDTIKLIRYQVLQPYFFGGHMCHLEKGETIKIAGHEFFINECQPRTGIVDESSIIEVEIGFTQETFQKKQVLADQRYAERLQQQMSTQQQSGFPFGIQRQHSHPHETVQNLEQYFQREREHELMQAAASEANNSRNSHSSSHRRRRRHSQNATSGVSSSHNHHNNDADHEAGAQQQMMQSLGGSGQSRSGHMNLLEILNHIQMGSQLHNQVSGNDEGFDPFGAYSKATPKAIVESLPIRVMSQEQIDQGKQSSTESEDSPMTKCMVCLVEYEATEELRTMPCLHFFHKECIDKWLLERGSTCPVCNFNVRKDYNVTSAAQMSSNRRNSERRSGRRQNDIFF